MEYAKQKNEDSDYSQEFVKKRKRKTSDQLRTLENEFENNPHWSKETLLMIAVKTCLTEAQIYKWGWD